MAIAANSSYCFRKPFCRGGAILPVLECIRMWFELLNLILGIAFGFFHKGKEDYYSLLKNGVIVGVVLGIIFVFAVLYIFHSDMIIDVGSFGAPGFFIAIVLFLVIFIIGAFIGDKIESLMKK